MLQAEAIIQIRHPHANGFFRFFNRLMKKSSTGSLLHQFAFALHWRPVFLFDRYFMARHSKKAQPTATPTPPQTLQQAGLLRRLGAWAVDALLVGALLSVTLLLALGLAHGLLPAETDIQRWLVEQPLLTLLLAAELIGYFLWHWCRTGQTPGLLLLKLKVQREDGALLTVSGAMIRMLTSAFGLGNLLVVMDLRHRAFQDMWADSAVIELGSLRQRR